MTYQAMAQARTAKGDKPGAVKDLQKAVALDPKNSQANNLLQQLK
jgi:Flp pilus assembly protein TadD